MQYNHAGDPVDVTFGVKELKVPKAALLSPYYHQSYKHVGLVTKKHNEVCLLFHFGLTLFFGQKCHLTSFAVFNLVPPLTFC